MLIKNYEVFSILQVFLDVQIQMPAIIMKMLQWKMIAALKMTVPANAVVQ